MLLIFTMHILTKMCIKKMTASDTASNTAVLDINIVSHGFGAVSKSCSWKNFVSKQTDSK